MLFMDGAKEKSRLSENTLFSAPFSGRSAAAVYPKFTRESRTHSAIHSRRTADNGRAEIQRLALVFRLNTDFCHVVLCAV